MNMQDREYRSFRPGAVLGGVLLLAFGAGLLLDRSVIFPIHHFVGPMVLILIGSIMTFEHGALVYTVPLKDDSGDVRLRVRRRRSSSGGLWLIGVGIWMLVSQNHLWGFTFATSWPLFIIFMGLTMVVRGWR